MIPWSLKSIKLKLAPISFKFDRKDYVHLKIAVQLNKSN